MVEGFLKGRYIAIIQVSICNQNVGRRGNIVEQISGDIGAPKVVIDDDCFLVIQDRNDCRLHLGGISCRERNNEARNS